MSATSGLDPITVEVIHNYLLSAAREMERNLMRTSYSTVIYEVRDFGLGIYDRECRMLAEAPGLAVFTRGNDYGLKKTVEFVGEENMAPDDLLLTSYPYWSSAHPLDVLAVSPIFVFGELVGYTAIKQHWLDLGQKDAGYILDSTDVFQEGLLLPGLKLYKAGVLNQEIENLLRFNSRLPDRIIGDLNAQVSACRTGERRVIELVERFGLEQFREATEAILDHGERLSRSRLAALPNGTWSAEDWADDDGIDHDTMLKLKVKVTVTDDEFIVDWSGSQPATRGPMNLPIGLTEGVSALAFKGVTTPDTPANSGNYRPLRVIAPPGEMMHAIPPAPTFTVWAALLAPEVILKALSQGMPERIPACSGGDVFSVVGLGVHPETGIIWLEGNNEAVGFGAYAGSDGEDAIMHLSEPGCRNNPVEVLETKAPWIVEKYGMRRDSGGPGEIPRWRGRDARLPLPVSLHHVDAGKKDEVRAMGHGRRPRCRSWPRRRMARHGQAGGHRRNSLSDGRRGRDSEQFRRWRRLGQPEGARPAAGAGGRHQRVCFTRVCMPRLRCGH